ncbi:Myb-like_DNA-binding domain-containing protein [Hexamita inflata]|uniref:Myb-like DNA-binding domain-containing protein n=1 Tax=Hexamita inflata TaxID=28002 RepID=A0AA86VIB7_9EUKA|nr:Myb-like DNA-binding domain-containing protein [Hexamita inflata]
MKITRTEWRQDEIDQLVQLTKSYRDNNIEVNWDVVSVQMQRTRSQCKSYYQIVLKKQFQFESRKNHMWTTDEIMGLWSVMQISNEDFELVQSTHSYFSQFTLKQLRGQYMSIQKRCVQYMDDFTHVTADPSYIALIPDKLFIQECFVINVGSQHEVNDEFYDPNSGQLPNYKKQNNETAFKSFWRNFNPLDLRVVYVIEQKRRGISDDEINAVKTI